MKIASAALTLASLLSLTDIMAQRVDITPRPQRIEWGGPAFAQPEGFKIKGEKTADPDAVDALRKSFPQDKGVRLSIGERGDKAVASVEHLIPAHQQGYYMKITPEEVIIAGNDPTGTYYGVQTLLSVIAVPQVMCVEITDWPVAPNRGVVEGFYGNAWSYEDRVSQFDFYGRHKLDTYIFGPKNDPYHRGKWREPYPDAEAEYLRALVDLANHRKVKFVWGIHPALDHSWEEDDNMAMVRKLEQLHSLGVRNFAVFFDDVFGKAADGKKHAVTMDYVMRNFVDKHPDIESLIMCPSLYNKGWAPRFQETYLNDISVMDPFIQIMWTGDKVVDMIHTSDLEWVNPQIGRKAFVWHNYPVSDYCVDHLLMGPYEGNDTDVTRMVSGFTANPMEYAEASKVSLFGTADYLWNPDTYDAKKAWELAMMELVPDHAEAFRTFCSYNIDPGQTAHKFRRIGESPQLKTLIDEYEAGFHKGDTAGLKAVDNEFIRVEAAGAELLKAASTNRLLSEVKPWIEATQLLGMRGQAVADMYRALAEDNVDDFFNSYFAYAYLTDRASAIASRNFKGSIKPARPIAGTLYAEPFLRRSVAEMIKRYEKTNAYRIDVFPHQLLENGPYIIKADSLFLTNANTDSPALAPNIDDVNPDNQIWRLEYHPETKAYTITNAANGRVIDNYGNFAEPDADPTQYTFEITPAEVGYSLTSVWSGYPTYLSIKDGKLTRQMKPSGQTIFSIEKAEKE